MPNATDSRVLDALLDSWDRNNTILVNLLRALPDGALDLSAADDSPSVGRLYTHMHFVRLAFLNEDAPEFARSLPEGEWREEHDRDRIAAWLDDSAQAVREAVRRKVETGGAMAVHYDHPILFLQHMIWHEGYHHGQIKIALKRAGQSLSDDVIGPLTWGVWMHKREPVGSR